MWKNYWLTSFRSFKRNKFHFSVNLISIAIAIALCIIGWFNYTFNSTFNAFFPAAEKIYKVNSRMESGDYAYGMGISTAPLATTINDNLTGAEAARYQIEPKVFRQNNELFKEYVAYVDPNFLEIFEFPKVDGEMARMNNKSGVLLSHHTAEKYFGFEDPIGESIELLDDTGQGKTYLVEGVIAKYPFNTSFHFDVIMHIDNFFDSQPLAENDPELWVNGTFVKLSNTHNHQQFNADLKPFLEIQNKANEDNRILEFRLDNILVWPEFETQLYKSRFMGVLHPASVLGTISSGIAILLLACFNFVNTTIAISRKRLKEIGIRKVVGGSKLGLTWQFLFESLFQILLAMLMSAVVSYYLVDLYNALFEFDVVQFEFLDVGLFIIFIVSLWLLIGILSGIYPALYISKFPSLEIFNNRLKFSGKNKFGKALLAFQFTVCVYNVFSLVVFYQNAKYQEVLDRGYDIESVINIPLSSADQYEVLSSEIATMPGVLDISGTANVVGRRSSDITFNLNGFDHNAVEIHVGSNYMETLGIRIAEGRFFRQNIQLDQNKVIVNETFANSYGLSGPDEIFLVGQQRFTVIGIAEDFNFRSIMLDNKIKPLIIFPALDDQFTHLTVRTTPENILAMNKELESLWNDLFPGLLYQGSLQEMVMKPLRHTNRIMISINSFVGLISILISMLGLYSLITLNIQNRIKEIGVRKILGATIMNISFLLNRQFILLLAGASIIGLIASSIVINNLLDIIYAYHIEFELLFFVIPVVFIFTVAALTVGFKTWTAANVNPVEHLRNE